MRADETLWQSLVERQWLIRGDDGAWLFWPPGWNKGAWDTGLLRSLAARIDDENQANFARLLEGLRERT